MLRPKGLLVRALAFFISVLTSSVLPTPLMIPSPPASLTAAAKDASAIQAMPPWIIGYFILSKSVILESFITPPATNY